jgi:hypothetical protein
VSDNLESAIIGSAIATATAFVVFALTVRRESRIRHEDAQQALADRREQDAFLRQQYFVESSADIAARVWDAIRRAKSLEAEKTVPWPHIVEILLDLEVELQGQAPLYRLAGVEAASQKIVDQLKEYLGRLAETQGRTDSNRNTYRSMIEAFATPGTPATQVEAEVRAKIGFDETDVDRALELFRKETFAQMQDRVFQLLKAVSKHDPGTPFDLPQNLVPYADFSEVWAAVKKETRATDQSVGG